MAKLIKSTLIKNRKWSLVLGLLILLACKSEQTPKEDIPKVAFDNHVHLMSPDLIALWKGMGIPFSRGEANYFDVDTILRNTKADKIDLIGMAYVYGNEDFYQGDDRYERVKAENDYLFKVAAKYPQRIRPFFALDPLADYSLTELARCGSQSGAKGLKLHFSNSGVYLTEAEHLSKVYPVFEYAADNGIPILLHFDNWHPQFGAPDIRLLVDSILMKLPPLELTIAHMGTSGGFNEKTKRIIDEFAALFTAGAIPERHKVRLDISAVALDKNSEGVSKLNQAEFVDLKIQIEKLGLDKIVFGSDYPLYNSYEYAAILKERLNFSDQELEQIMQR